MNAAQIQAIIDAAADYCIIPPGVHQIDATIVVNRTGLRIVGSGAVFERAFPPNGGGDAMLMAIVLSDNVTVERITFDGQNDVYGGWCASGRAHNVYIVGSTNITLRDITARRGCCDALAMNRLKAGTFVAGIGGLGIDVQTEDIELDNFEADEAYRQGMSIASIDGMLVHDSRFINTGMGPAGYTAPGAGVDLESNVGAPPWIPQNIVFRDCLFSNNQGGQFLASNSSDHITIEDSELSHGGSYGFSTGWTNMTLRRLLIDDVGQTSRPALNINDGSENIVIEDVTIRNARWGPLSVQDSVYTEITRVTIEDCKNYGLRFNNATAPTPPPDEAEIHVRDLTISNIVESPEFPPPTNYAYVFGTARCPVWFHGYLLVASGGVYSPEGLVCVPRGANLNSCDDLRGVDRFYSVGEFATYASYGFTQRNYY